MVLALFDIDVLRRLERKLNKIDNFIEKNTWSRSMLPAYAGVIPA